MKFLPPTVFFAVAALMALAHFVAPGPALLPTPLRLLGLPVFAFGAWIDWAGAMRFHRSGTDIRAIEAPTRLITDGLHAFSRNPIHRGFVAMLVGATMGLRRDGAARPRRLVRRGDRARLHPPRGGGDGADLRREMGGLSRPRPPLAVTERIVHSAGA